MNVISLGAGVQSTAMHLMAQEGELGTLPDYSIFSDTGWEPKAVYKHLEWLESVSSIPILRVQNGNIREMLTEPEQSERTRIASVPFFLDDGSGKRGMGRRQCTHEFKLKPLHWEFRRLLGKGGKDRIPKGSIRVWIGISLDEAHRMKPSHAAWMENHYPLIDKRMTRHDCLLWLKARGYPEPPKSSCIGCPFHGNITWRKMREEDPASWQDAVAVDEIIRDMGTQQNRAIRGRQFMHPSLIPLSQVDLRNASDFGQLDLFGNECEGMCGV